MRPCSNHRFGNDFRSAIRSGGGNVKTSLKTSNEDTTLCLPRLPEADGSGYDETNLDDRSQRPGSPAEAVVNNSRLSQGRLRVAEKPRLLVIERDAPTESMVRQRLATSFELVVARTVAKAIVLLREQTFAGVYIDSDQLAALRLAGVQVQSDEILDAIADGVAVVDPQLVVIWCNPEFVRLTETRENPVGLKFFRVLGSPHPVEDEHCPFTAAREDHKPHTTAYRTGENRYHRLTVTPVFDGAGEPSHFIVLTRDITDETLQQQKISAIHRAADELAEVTPEELAEMSAEDRIDLLKYNIQRHMENLFGLDFIEIRRLDPKTKRLVPLLAVRMTPAAAGRELYAVKEGNGVTGFVAATGQSYLCADASKDPLFLEGAAGARSSLTVPILDHGQVLGTLNVENVQPNAFDDRDRQFLEIYGRSVAGALKMLELLQAEKESTATASVDAISRELALPIDDIIGDATTILDRYAGHDEDIIHRLRHLLFRAREIRKIVHKVGTTIAPEDTRRGPRSRRPLMDVEVLVVDAEQTTRIIAHEILDQLGATVETARDAGEAIALARQKRYMLAMVDIRLPDLNGYETFCRLLEAQPDLPVVLMTGFGYDPHHSIPKSKSTGKLAGAFYKKWNIEDVLRAVEAALEFGRNAKPQGDGQPALPPSTPPAEATTG
jgi:two-component system, sensor histidine kinase SagS